MHLEPPTHQHPIAGSPLSFIRLNTLSLRIASTSAFMLLSFGSSALAQVQPVPDSSVDPNGWRMSTSPSTASLRGLSVVDDETVWTSGSGGSVLRTEDGGKQWQLVSPAGFEACDFRCLHAFSADTAVIASSGDRDVILRTVDKGQSWNVVYETDTSLSQALFFDGFAFWDSQRGILMSDPVDGIVFLLRTDDGGATWQVMHPGVGMLTVAEGEAGFAASGTNLCVWGSQNIAIGLGGGLESQASEASRVWYSHDAGATWSVALLPMQRGTSSGVFSIAAVATTPRDQLPASTRLIAVGGDYRQTSLASEQVAISDDGGKSWRLPQGARPHGFRSVVTTTMHDSRIVAVAIGPSGCDVSLDQGEHWIEFSDEGFHAAAFSPSGTVLWASGAEGRIGSWSTKDLP